LCCQVHCIPQFTAAKQAIKTNSQAASQNDEQQFQKIKNNQTKFSESQAYIMFVTNKCELKELESVNLSLGEQLANLCAPHIVSII
jgi:hypothetical protein